jgi:hypothetical protein
MKSLLESITEVDEIIRQLHKMESRLRSGQIIDAWRECCRLMAYLDNCKKQIISGETAKKDA